MIYQMLIRYLIWNAAEKFQEKLESSEEIIDIFYNDCEFLKIAIENNHTEILNIIIKYYEEKHLRGDPESFEYKCAKQKLLDGVENAIDSTLRLTLDAKEILKEYIKTDEDDQSVRGLEEEEVPVFDEADPVEGVVESKTYEDSKEEASLIGDLLD